MTGRGPSPHPAWICLCERDNRTPTCFGCGKTYEDMLAYAAYTAGRQTAPRHLVIRFEVDPDCILTDAELLDLGDRIVAEQIDPDPPVLTFDGVDVVRATAKEQP